MSSQRAVIQLQGFPPPSGPSSPGWLVQPCVARSSPAGARLQRARALPLAPKRLVVSRSAKESAEKARAARLCCPPLSEVGETACLPGGSNARRVRMATSRAVPFGCDQHVVAHRVQALAAKRTAIGRRLLAAHPPSCPPASVLRPVQRCHSTVDVVRLDNRSSGQQTPGPRVTDGRHGSPIPRSLPQRCAASIPRVPAAGCCAARKVDVAGLLLRKEQT
jgi:hypothetical protein